MELLKKIFKTIHRYWVQRSSEAYLKLLANFDLNRLLSNDRCTHSAINKP